MTGGAGLLLILDYDGTLTPIVPWPDAAVLAASVRGTLSRLTASGRARVAILSGRALADLRARVRLANVVYGGCHGPDEKAVFEELCQVVEEAIALYHQDGKPLPPPTSGKDYANKMPAIA